jgi:hypothetical protein
MGRKRHSAEAIVNKLRHADVELAKGQSVAGVCKPLASTLRETVVHESGEGHESTPPPPSRTSPNR